MKGVDMSIQTENTDEANVVNGIDTAQVMELVNAIESDSNLAQCVFKAENTWKGGALNQTHVKGFSVNGEEVPHTPGFKLNCDEPPSLGGIDSAPNPVEFLLHSLMGCITTTTVAHAAVEGIEIEELQTETEGDLDLHGFLGLSDKVRNGFSAVRLTLGVKTDASSDKIKELALRSPVYDTISNSLPVEVIVKKL